MNCEELYKQIQCVKRELALRCRVYPKWVSLGKLQQSKADEEINLMRGVLNTLTALYNKLSPATQQTLINKSEYRRETY